MSLSEAIDSATKLMAQFPNAKGYSDGFIGALAQVFGQYPRQVVSKCVDVRSGLARDVKFLSISDVVAWLERGERPLHESAARDERVKRQVRDTEEWLRLKVPESLKAKGKAWLDRTDPVAQQISGQMPKVVTKEQREAFLASARQAGRELRGMSLRPETLATMGMLPPRPPAKEVPGPYSSEWVTPARSQNPEEVAVDFGVEPAPVSVAVVPGPSDAAQQILDPALGDATGQQLVEGERDVGRGTFDLPAPD
jgi:hypothetical protein